MVEAVRATQHGGGAALALALMLIVILGGCTPLGVLGKLGAEVGNRAYEERGISGAAKDTATRLAVNEAWSRHADLPHHQLDLAVHNGRVLAMGTVANERQRVAAVQRAWQAPGVREVINEIRLGAAGGLNNFARDHWIEAEIATRLLFDRATQSVNYQIRSVDGVVYILGVGQSPAEIARVSAHAANTPYVRDVINHATLVGTPE